PPCNLSTLFAAGECAYEYRFRLDEIGLELGECFGFFAHAEILGFNGEPETATFPKRPVGRFKFTEVCLAGPPPPIEGDCPRTIGFWKQQCGEKGSRKPVADSLEILLDCVQTLSDVFDDIADVDGLCAILDPAKPVKEMRVKARQQYMALLLNCCSGRLSVETCEAAIDFIEAILLNPEATKEELEDAKDLADGINNSADPACEEEQTSNSAPIILYQNRSNPFGHSTEIDFVITGGEPTTLLSASTPLHVTIKVFDLTGQQIKILLGAELEPGTYTVEWNGENEEGQTVPNGIYFYRLRAGNYSSTKKMILIH
ncbi:T9SS type A sorting domain-containing protein, partial [candidate division TA06 bacterium]|nr:T9SS type A sorting domain-containing protein [candidate division TA06 bacterium]